MKPLRLALNDAAMADILEQFDWYADKGGHTLAKRWEAGVTSTLLQIARRPSIGSPCKFRAEALRGTRCVSVSRFPKHLVFYQARESEVFILRIVHGARDLQSLFGSRTS